MANPEIDNYVTPKEELNLKRVPHVAVKLITGVAFHAWNCDVTNPQFLRGYSERNMLGADEIGFPWTSMLHFTICQKCRMGLDCPVAVEASPLRRVK